jgi:DTW domain-containing protein YfiP
MAQRDRCYGCFRPQDDCFCDAIPVIHNQTNVLILQHVRERYHPFNTARIVRKALQNSRLLVGDPKGLAATNLPIRTRAGLLYPGSAATLISDLPPDQRPGQLVILDGTWHQAKTMFRDIPALHELPQYKLAPDSPGRYRIRREPDATSLSTLEAATAALCALEPATSGFDQLLEAFETMVDRQLARLKSKNGWRRNARRHQNGTNTPRVLVGDLAHVVVAYGESAPGGRGKKCGLQTPVYWVAQRLGTNERFASAIEPGSALTDQFLGHLELTERDFADPLSHEAFRTAWANFLHPADTLVVYHQSTLLLLSHVRGSMGKCLVLKSVRLNPRQTNGTLEERLASEGLASGPAEHPGRAGQRLAKAIALVRHLNALGRPSKNEMAAPHC